MKNLWMVMAALTLIIAGININASEGNKSNHKIMGTWSFEVKEAPYEYQRGKTTFYQADTLMRVKIDFDYETITGSKLIIEGDKINFDVEVQGEIVNIALKFVNNELIGKALTSQGELPVVMKRAKD